MKQSTFIGFLVFTLILSLSLGCEGSSNSTAEEVVNSVMKALQSGDKEAYMSQAYNGTFEDLLNEMDEYEEFWQDIEEEEALSIDNWTTPVVIETMPSDETEGDITSVVFMETVVSLTFEDDHETETFRFVVVQTSEGWFLAEIDA